jgi:hypothetical protein
MKRIMFGLMTPRELGFGPKTFKFGPRKGQVIETANLYDVRTALTNGRDGKGRKIDLKALPCRTKIPEGEWFSGNRPVRALSWWEKFILPYLAAFGYGRDVEIPLDEDLIICV